MICRGFGDARSTWNRSLRTPVFTIIQIDLLSAAQPARSTSYGKSGIERARLAAARRNEKHVRVVVRLLAVIGAREEQHLRPVRRELAVLFGHAFFVSWIGAEPSAAMLHNSILSVSAGSRVGRRLTMMRSPLAAILYANT